MFRQQLRTARTVTIAALMITAAAASPLPVAAGGDILILDGGFVTEGETGQAQAVFTARLMSGEPSQTQVTARFRTSQLHIPAQSGEATEGTACGGGVDFVRQDRIVTIPANASEVTINVPVCGDAAVEPDEYFFGGISDVQGADCTSDTCGAYGLIINNDNPAQLPTLSVANDSETEGDGSIFPSRLRFVVTLSTASNEVVTVQASTAAGFASKAVPTVSAVAGAKNCLGADTDYIAKSTTVQFEPGQTAKNVDVTICQDTRNELNENMRLVLSAPTNASVADGEATAYILDDD